MAANNMLKITRLKSFVQMIFFFLIVYVGYFGVREIAWKNITLIIPTLSCYYTNHRIASCFIRSLQEGLSDGWKVGYTTLLAPILLLFIFGLIFGRSWCSWVCPLGFIQDLFIRFRKFLKIGYYNLSDNLKAASVSVKWFFVISIVCIAAGIGIPHFFLKEYQYDLITPFCQICPSKQIFPFVEGRFKEMLAVDNISALTTVMGYLAMGVFAFYLLTTSFIRRMWCRLCPMGAVLGLFNRFSFLSLRKEGKRCTKCGVCQRSCPVQVSEVYEEKEKERISPSDCTLCFRCVEMCPEKDALKVGLFKFPIARSKYKRFLQSSAVKVSKCKRRIPGEKQQ
jgi:ferredoxin-type protein NapH